MNLTKTTNGDGSHKKAVAAPVELTTICLRAQVTGPRLVITAGVHGDEYEPMLAVRRLVGEFEEHLLAGSVTLVPVVNENAFTRGQRTADDELDLARVCPGKDEGSVTERTAAALSRLIRTADFYIDLHTGGRLYRILPLAGYILHSDSDVLKSQQSMAKAFGVPIVWGTNSRFDGRSLSVARDELVPAIYVEYGGAELSVAAIEPLVEGCLRVAAHLEMIDPVALPRGVEYFVEDDREDSGYLQIQHPSPMAGLFEPRVQLGCVVQAGDLLGEVIDPLSERRSPVVAESKGILLFVRVSPCVQKGDGLCGILPISQPGEASFERQCR